MYDPLCAEEAQCRYELQSDVPQIAHASLVYHYFSVNGGVTGSLGRAKAVKCRGSHLSNRGSVSGHWAHHSVITSDNADEVRQPTTVDTAMHFNSPRLKHHQPIIHTVATV